MKRRLAAALALLLALAPAAPADAAALSFGNAFIPAPGHGVFLFKPFSTASLGNFGVWSLTSVGLARPEGWGPLRAVGLTIDSLYVALPGLPKYDFGNTLISLNCGLGRPVTGVPLDVTITPLVGVRSGGFGRSFAGSRAFVDWRPAPGLVLHNSPAFYYSPDGAPEPLRLKLDSCLEWKPTTFAAGFMEVLSGWPFWDYGPNTCVAVSPGVTWTLGPTTSLQTGVRLPLVASATAKGLEAPIAIVGFGQAW